MPDQLFGGQSMDKGESLTSPDGRKVFKFQEDSNIALYHDGYYVWGTGAATMNNICWRMTLGVDGNLCVYNPNQKSDPFWETGRSIHGQGNVRMALQDDGNLVIYHNNTYHWATETVRVHRFRKIVFVNSGRTAFDSYPLVRDAKTGNTIWSGRWNSGFYWCTRQNDWKTVDFGADLDHDGKVLSERLQRGPTRAVKLGLEIVAGDNVFFNQDTFVYDPDCTDVWMVAKIGGLRDGDRGHTTLDPIWYLPVEGLKKDGDCCIHNLGNNYQASIKRVLGFKP